MKSLGFNHVIADSYRKGNIAVHDLKPRNVLIDSDGDVYVIDAEFINTEFETTNNIRFQLADDKPLRLPQTIARQTLDQMKADTKNKVPANTVLDNAIDFIQNTDWYNKLNDNQKARVNKTALKSLLENAIKDTNYLEDKIADYKQQIKDNKMTTKQVFDDIMAFLKTNQIKGKITPTEINKLIKSAAEITTKKDTTKALDDFMKLYKVIKEKALLRSDNIAKEKAEVEYVVPIVESLVQSGYDLEQVLDYFETDSQKRMAEIQYYKEKSKYATEEERVNKAKETLDKQREDLRNATYISFRDWLKRTRLYWFNLMSDRSFVPATLMKKTGMMQSYYQFKNTNGYGHNAKEMYDKAFDKIWKTLTVEKVELLNDFIQMMRIIEIENNTSKVIQHPNNLSSLDAKSFLNDQKRKLGQKEFNDMQKRAREYFNVYQEILDLQLENGFISQETYDALNDLVAFICEALCSLGINLQVTDTEIQALIGKVEKQQKAKKELENQNINNNFALNTTQDGQKFLSLAEPSNGYESRPDNVQQEENSGDNSDSNTSVRALWAKDKNFKFSGKTKIKNAEDVAHIMSLLENKSVEHAFAVHIDDKGNSHIQFIGISGVASVLIDGKIINAGVTKFNSKKVYLVHNHPSGNMQPSDADLKLNKLIKEGLQPLGVKVEHVIMDTYKKQYVYINSYEDVAVRRREEKVSEKNYPAFSMTEQEILREPFGKVSSSNDAFRIIQNFRFSAMPKNALLILNQKNEVIANYVLNNGLDYKQISNYVGNSGIGTNVIF